MLEIRRFESGDEETLRTLFYYTVRKICINDYTDAQVSAWAPNIYVAEDWNQKIALLNPFIVLLDGQVVGYADLQPDGYVDHFFCHWQHQGKGVGTALMQQLIAEGARNFNHRLYANVSLTAKPFFERHGFIVAKQQSVDIRGQTLTNFLMEKDLNK
ncbi:GNAT family N-acetyltransferase [Vibrio rotiferianus]|uniref:GNAT family N-acetyltransferase n=1 Tax=Vibrio rotiferianus TaxID=190895 RepID=A0A7Y3ZBY7_9VIBR|nr:GNAT family N-acetyltransferase [Vibrio rotiferianus]NOH50193.1 GNAT family N-acetyltransferase [Vibrio rotiferianus]CAH1589963.1 GNAT family N-acetyltransferase [Vibrio rotiferianus]CAH1591346.1 GNAT family N-acetyltransferase [Vibrio rotiferianus]